MMLVTILYAWGIAACAFAGWRYRVAPRERYQAGSLLLMYGSVLVYGTTTLILRALS